MKEQLLKLAKLFNRADKLRLIKLFVLMIIGSLLDVASGGEMRHLVLWQPCADDLPLQTRILSQNRN